MVARNLTAILFTPISKCKADLFTDKCSEAKMAGIRHFQEPPPCNLYAETLEALFLSPPAGTTEAPSFNPSEGIPEALSLQPHCRDYWSSLHAGPLQELLELCISRLCLALKHHDRVNGSFSSRLG